MFKKNLRLTNESFELFMTLSDLIFFFFVSSSFVFVPLVVVAVVIDVAARK